MTPYTSSEFTQTSVFHFISREEKVKEDETDSSLGGPDHAAGITTPRSSVTGEPPVLNKRLGIYQRPMSAHGVRNQQVNNLGT